MSATMPRKASEYKRKGLSVSPSDGGWLASYRNSAKVTQEIGIWPDEITATRAGILWCQGFRFDVIRAEYESGQALHIIAGEYNCRQTTIRECVIFGGGTIVKKAPNPANKLGKKFGKLEGEQLKLRKEIMLRNRKNRTARIDAFEVGTTRKFARCGGALL